MMHGQINFRFAHYFINSTIFEEKRNVIEYKIRVLFSEQLLSETFVILR